MSLLNRAKLAWKAMTGELNPALALPTPSHELINRFESPDEPKVRDYPKGVYYTHWEIVVGEVDGGYSAVVRFYPNIAAPELKGQLEYTFIEPSLVKLKEHCNKLIRTRMEDFRR